MNSIIDIVETNSYFTDKMQPGAFIGATMVASGIKNSAIVFHGYLGCNIESIHMRSDMIPGGFYTPIVATGLNESDSIYGGNEKLKSTLKIMVEKKYDLIWILTSDATSITADDIYSVAKTLDKHDGLDIIPLDVPGFLGGIARGTDIAVSRLFDFSHKPKFKTDSLCLVAPHLLGIKSHPNDILEIESLLRRSGIEVTSTLSKFLQKKDLEKLALNKFFLPLTFENMTLLKEQCTSIGSVVLEDDLPIPVGIANTEQWLLHISKIFGCEEKAKSVLLEDKDIVLKQLKYNYNFSWLSTLFTEKTCSIYGSAQFAVSLALCLFYDLNIKPDVIAILAETPEAVEKSKRILLELSQYHSFTLLINPDYYTYVKKIKEKKVDFAIGSVQDKPLCVGEGIPHMSLSGYYFFNNFNFTPWPYMGIKGMLSILTELGHQMEKTFYYEQHWKNYSYKPSETA